MLRATALSNVLGFTATVNISEVPCARVCEAGETARVKVAEVAITVRLRVNFTVELPDAHVMTTGYVPAAAVLLAVRVKRVDPFPVTEAGLNDPVTPVGKPLSEKVTVPVPVLHAILYDRGMELP